MKRKAAAIFLAVSLLTIEPFFAQVPNASEQDQINELVKEIQAQQATIQDNQAKLADQLATLTETIRQARIFASRGGS